MKRFLIQTSRWELVFLFLLSLIWIMQKPWLLLLFLGLPLFWVGALFRTGQLFPSTSLDLPFFFLSFLTLLSLFVTPDIESSAGKVLGVFLGISYYYALVRLVSGKNVMESASDSINLFLAAWVLFGFICLGGVISLLGLFGAAWFNKYPILTNISGIIPNLIPALPDSPSGFQPNAISGTLTLFTPITATVIWGLGKPWGKTWLKYLKPLSSKVIRIVLGFVFVLNMIWWIIAQTRGAWLGLAAGMLLLVLWNLFNRTWRWSAFLIPFLGVLLIYIYWFRSENLAQEINLINSLKGGNLTNTLNYRLHVWEWGLKTMQGFPFTGLGYNIFRVVAPRLFFGPNLGDVAHAHNIWLDIAVTLGIGGIITYLSLWIVNGYSLLKTMNLSPQGWQQHVGLGLLAGWYAYFIFGIADTIPLGSKLGLTIFITLALGQIISSKEF